MDEITLANLYPQLNKDQLQEAEEAIEQYLQLALRIYERIREDPELYAKFRHLTAEKPDSSMHGEPSGSP
jgi:hypothetical protein